MATLDLFFDSRTFRVPTKSVLQLLAHLRLFEAKIYELQSSAPNPIFEAFVDSQKPDSRIPAMKGNAVSLWLFAKESFLSKLEAECTTFSVSIDQFALVS
jgi:hypothetical protein